MGGAIMIRTSEAGWLERLTRTYRSKQDTNFVDDAHLGVDPENQTIRQMGTQAGLGMVEWKRVAGCAGVGSVGVLLIAMAMLDPEPTSKLALIVGTGAFCVLSGAGGAIYLLTGLRPPCIEREGPVFRIRWE
jgi:hypothetical protein